MIFARQSTAIIVTVGPVLDASGVAVTDGVVGDFKISKNGGAPAALNGSATLTHRNTGHYSLSLTATDVNTVGTAEIVIDDTVNACPMKEITVVEPTTYDVLFADAAPGPASPTNITAGTVTTATNVTTVNGLAANVITAAATAADFGTEMAAAIWQDAVAGDFTVASSIGKALYVSNVVPGAAGGHFIAGTNAPVTITGSGNALTLTSTGGNGHGLAVAGNGSGEGISATGGATGNGIEAVGGATSGDGVRFRAATSGSGIRSVGAGDGHGMYAQAGSSSSANGIYAESGADFGAGIYCYAGGIDSAGLICDGVFSGIYTVSGSGDDIFGNITGNLSGSVGSLTTNNDKTGYTLSSAGLADFFDTDSGTTYASAVAGSVVKEIADNAGGSSLTPEDIADAVWDEDATGHQTQGTFGQAIGDPAADTDTIYALANAIKADTAAILDDTGTAGVIVASLAANSITANVIANGAIDAATFAADVDAEILSYIVDDATRIDASALNTASVTTIPAIVVDTNELQTDWADGGRLDLILDARASQSSVDTIDGIVDAILVDTGTTLDAAIADLPTNAELATALGTADDAVLAAVATVDTVVDAIKAKTDSLTFTTAGQVDANVQYVNGTEVTGDGQAGTEWGPA